MTITLPAWLLPTAIMCSSFYLLNNWVERVDTVDRQIAAWVLWIAISGGAWAAWWSVA